MIFSAKMILLALTVFCNLLQPVTTAHPRIKFEVRLAESKPAEGLIKATVQNESEEIYLHKEALITNKDVIEARTNVGGMVDGNSVYNIEIDLTEGAGEKMGKATSQHIGKPMAIMIDGKVILTATVQAKVSDKVMISTALNKEKAERIVEEIKSK